MGLLAGLVSASNPTKCISSCNRKCENQPIFINLHPNEYSQEFYYYPFTVKLHKCVGSCNTFSGYLIKYVFQIKFKSKRVQHDH